MVARQSRWTLSAIALVAAIAWLFASNHCAIAAVSQAAKAADHSCCHKAAESKAPHQPSQCCEAFNVPVPDQAAAPVVKLHELPLAWVPALAVETELVSWVPSVSLSDTGPPSAGFFTELVLQKNLPAHAPPAFRV